MKTQFLFALATTLFLVSCTPKETVQTPEEKDDTVIDDHLEGLNMPPTPLIYNPSETRHFDLLHTRLDVAFDWSRSQLNGVATLDLTPYFYPTSQLVLDAKGFDVHKVSLSETAGLQTVPYTYDGAFITITLPREYKRSENVRVVIEYTAKPDELEVGGSAAITSDKGLYFINPKGENPYQMPQIWTQGETESSSCWFPTIDAPNERMTQELFMTVDDKYTTLSNGVLQFSTDNGDGTRTDAWKMDKPHAPYLAMMAVGEFVKVTDTWRDSISVDYYVEKEWEPYARDIFGATPEMLEFFSKRLGVNYPWPKYAQIVVRDYVSGAMENTSAVIHGDFLYRNRGELLDEHNESIIAHELFHHWFGDLVTCESWANLPLNESFANYSQFLWDEYKHGDDYAAHYSLIEMLGYMAEAESKQVDLIRYDYLDKEDMFDAHSYNKGGRILHMLRKYVGDDAFFESLNLYLTDNAYDAAEIHHLRLAFEKVTGEDMNWFFNQWFLASGHPVLDISYDYDAKNQEAVVTIQQKQNFDNTPLYRLPMKVDVYVGKSIQRHDITLRKATETFRFPANIKPSLVNVDAEKVILAQKTDHKDQEEWAFQYRHAPLYMDRWEALVALGGMTGDSLAEEVLFEAMDDKFWGLRVEAMDQYQNDGFEPGKRFQNKLVELAKAKDAYVRAEALTNLRTVYEKDDALLPVYQAALNDSSYATKASGLLGLNGINPKMAVTKARQMKDEPSTTLKTAIAEVLSMAGNADDNSWYLENAKRMSGFESFYFLQHYTLYLESQGDKEAALAIPEFEKRATADGAWWMKIQGYYGLLTLREKYKAKMGSLSTKMRSLEQDPNADAAAKAQVEQDLNKAVAMYEQLDKIIETNKAKETDPQLLGILNRWK